LDGEPDGGSSDAAQGVMRLAAQEGEGEIEGVELPSRTVAAIDASDHCDEPDQ
jgi:hypothetical protein